MVDSGEVSLLKGVQAASVANQQVVWESLLLELNIFRVVFVLFVVKEILLGSLWEIIGEDRVFFNVFRLILGNAGSNRLLK